VLPMRAVMRKGAVVRASVKTRGVFGLRGDFGAS
jgi:hypothetical protein